MKRRDFLKTVTVPILCAPVITDTATSQESQDCCEPIGGGQKISNSWIVQQILHEEVETATNMCGRVPSDEELTVARDATRLRLAATGNIFARLIQVLPFEFAEKAI